MAKPGDLVIVEWLDAVGSTNSGPPELAPCRTVGWLWEVNADAITIKTSDYGGADGDFVAIPASWQAKIKPVSCAKSTGCKKNKK